MRHRQAYLAVPREGRNSINQGDLLDVQKMVRSDQKISRP